MVPMNTFVRQSATLFSGPAGDPYRPINVERVSPVSDTDNQAIRMLMTA